MPGLLTDPAVGGQMDLQHTGSECRLLVPTPPPPPRRHPEHHGAISEQTLIREIRALRRSSQTQSGRLWGSRV